MSQRQLLGVFAVGIVAVIAFSFIRGMISSPTSTTHAAGQSDAAIEAAMIENINRLSDSTAAVPRDASGKPDISVKDGVLIVATSDPGSASSLCRAVAAVTNSADTSKPLGVAGIIVISGGTQVATCHP